MHPANYVVVGAIFFVLGHSIGGTVGAVLGAIGALMFLSGIGEIIVKAIISLFR